MRRGFGVPSGPAYRFGPPCLALAVVALLLGTWGGGGVPAATNPTHLPPSVAARVPGPLALGAAATDRLSDPAGGPAVPVEWADLTKLSDTVPLALVLPAFADDPADGVDVLFGGTAYVPWVQAWELSNQTWTLANGTWNQSYPEPSPPALVGAAMTYDPLLDAVLLVGATLGGDGAAPVEQTWEFHAAAWTDLSSADIGSPPATEEASLAYDPVAHAVVRYGGYEYTAAGPRWSSNQTWLFANGTWENATHAVTPKAEVGTAMAYDPATQTVVLYGGTQLNWYGDTANATWSWANGTWSPLAPRTVPDGLADAALVWSPTLGALVLVGGDLAWDGGYDSDGSTHTWEYKNGNWTKVDLLGDSPWTSAVAAALDPTLGGIVALGSVATPSNYARTWELSRYPALAVDASPGTTDAGVAVQFGNDFPNASANASVVWSFGDGSQGIGSVASHVFDAPGTYLVNATATAHWGNRTGVDWAVRSVAIVPDPSTNLTAAHATIDVAETEAFQAVASGGTPPYEVSWSFGDGTNASGAWTVTHQYVSVGTYTSTVRVVDAFGVVAERSTVVRVEPFPRVTLAVSRTVVDLGQPITLWSATEFGAGPFNYSYVGLPPGCLSANAANLTCTPVATGEFDVDVTVVDVHGVHTSSGTALVTIDPRMAATLSLSAPVVDVGMAVTVTALFASEGSGNVSVAFSNDVGCGVPAGFLVTCLPPAPGTYPVTASATDAAGEVVSLGPLTLTVDPPVAVNVTGPAGTVVRDTLYTLSVSRFGGTAPFAISFPAVPPGCVRLNSTSFRCDSELPGSYAFAASVADSFGSNASARLVVVVVDGAPGGIGAPATAPAAPGPGVDVLLWAVVAAAIAQVALSIRYARPRRPRSRGRRRTADRNVGTTPDGVCDPDPDGMPLDLDAG
jgi:hypothetical protein